MSSLAVLVPVLRRPQNVAPLLASIDAATPVPFRVVFIADPDDREEHRAIPKRDDVDLMLHAGGYGQKINAAVRATTEPLLFIGADDLRFRHGWLEAAKARLSDGVEIVGVNDLLDRRPGREGHATHFLLTRCYAEQPAIDGGRGPLCEQYDHSFVDDELIGTATRRGAYAYAEDSHVQHLHVMNGLAPDDEVYRKGRARFRQDRQTYLRRRKLWT